MYLNVRNVVPQINSLHIMVGLNILSLQTNDIKRNKQHIRDLKCTLKADKLKRDMEFKETVKELNQNIRWAKENLKAVK
jgi:hypothetical protein